ncbi:MAG: endopeptidase La [Clostridia bacterium]|nr:endopeptidase La [Clostridia bacterium]
MKTALYKNIPVIPLRGLVVLPYSAMSFDVGREKSVLAAKAAMEGDGLVMLTSQHDAKQLEATKNNIYTCGCLCRIKGSEKLEGGSLRVLVSGQSRAKITAFIENDAYLCAEIESYENEAPSAAESLSALRELIEEKCEQYVSMIGNAQLKTTLSFIGRSANDVEYAYRVANVFLLDPADRQAMLETESYTERAIELVNMLGREAEAIKIKQLIDSNVKQQIDKNQREYYLREQMKAVRKELGEDEQSEADDFRRRLSEKAFPDEIRKKLEKEIERFAMLPSSSHETPSMRTYIDTLLSLPFTEMSEDDLDIEHARKVLDEDHYGLEKVKERILEFIAVAKLTGKVNGQIICFVGPPGVGKTSISSSIARALGREFVRMSLGGIHDEAEIRGHRRTYIGAMPGRIIAAMRQAQTVNPVLLFDEIDKLGADSFHGDPAAAMLEVLDSAQNFEFRDHFLEMPYDLSKVLFITTANDKSGIPRPLLDRMEIIEVPSYLANEKVEIALRHLVPRQLEKNGFKKSMLSVPRESVSDIINGYTREAGVRSLERCIATVCRKAAVDIAGGKKRVTVSRKKVEEYLGAPRFTYDPADKEPQVGLVNGLAWTSVGGEMLTVEVAVLPGTGKVQLTGQLGSVMQESAQAAITCIRERAQQLELESDFYGKTDIHIHLPEGAIPKDGPSAGITMFTAVTSALTGIPVRAGLAMTGEITLRGRVLPIGGLREKLLAAVRAGIDTVLIPEKNRKDLRDVPQDILDALNIIYVDNADEVLEHALTARPEKRIVIDPSPVAAGAPA